MSFSTLNCKYFFLLLRLRIWIQFFSELIKSVTPPPSLPINNMTGLSISSYALWIFFLPRAMKMLCAVQLAWLGHLSTNHADPEGGPDPPSPLKNYKNIGFLSNTGPDPLKKSQSHQASIQYWAIIGTPAKHHLNGVSLAGQ